MTIMSDRSIRETAVKLAMIEPFVKGQRRNGAISFGISSHGDNAPVPHSSGYRAVTD
jgi:dCTP deaminase